MARTLLMMFGLGMTLWAGCRPTPRVATRAKPELFDLDPRSVDEQFCRMGEGVVEFELATNAVELGVIQAERLAPKTALPPEARAWARDARWRGRFDLAQRTATIELTRFGPEGVALPPELRAELEGLLAGLFTELMLRLGVHQVGLFGPQEVETVTGLESEGDLVFIQATAESSVGLRLDPETLLPLELMVHSAAGEVRDHYEAWTEGAGGCQWVHRVRREVSGYGPTELEVDYTERGEVGFPQRVEWNWGGEAPLVLELSRLKWRREGLEI